MKIEKRKFSPTEFATYALKTAAHLVANPDAAMSTALTAAVDVAEKSTGGEFEVDVPVMDAPPAAPSADLAPVLAKLDAIQEAVSAFSGGVTAKAAFDAAVAKQGIAVGLAVELLTAYQARIAAIAAQLQSGGADLDREKLYDALRGYDVADACTNALTVMGKADGAPAAEVLTEVSGAVQSAFTAKAEAIKADAAAAGTTEETITCKQCGAKMKKGEDVCPSCGWKIGAPVAPKTAKRAAAVYPDRYGKK